MSAMIETIQQIRSLRADLRQPRLPAAVAKSIETIKQTLMASADHSGWKKVDWRSAPSKPSQGYGQAQPQQHRRPASSHSNPSSHSRNENPFHRNRVAPPRESLPSIPLTYASAASVAPSASSDGEGFEVVRRGRRDHVPSGPPHSSSSSHSSGPASHVEFRAPPPKYVSKFKRSAEKVEDTILNTILLGKLNKFSAANYNDIKEFITQIIDSGQTEMMSCFMKLVFEKAASEEIFCPLYAKLLSELSVQYPILLQEMATLYSQYMAIFVEVSDEPDKTHQEFVQRNVEKKYRRGYSQFLAELTKHNVIDSAVFVQTVLKIVEQIELNQSNPAAVKLVEELADCLVRMLKAIQMDRKGARMEADEKQEESIVSVIRVTLKASVPERIQPLTVRRAEAAGISNKARFTFMDIYEAIQQ